MGTILKAKDSYYSEYWFIPEGVLVIDIVTRSWLLLFVLVVGTGITLAAIYVPGILSLLLTITMLLALWWRIKRKRNHLSRLSPEQVLEKERGKIIPWPQVRKVNLKGDRLFILTDVASRTASSQRSEVGKISQFIKSRIGDRLVEADVAPSTGLVTSGGIQKEISRVKIVILIGAVALFAGVILVFAVPDSYLPDVVSLSGFALLLDSSNAFALRRPRVLGAVPRLLVYLSLLILNVGIALMLFSTLLFGSSILLTYSGITFAIGVVVPPYVLAKVIRSMVRGGLDLE